MSRGALLWVAAVVLMLSAASYQRITGPTKPVRGTLDIAGQELRYRLPRTQETVREARVAVPAPDAPGVEGRIEYRRYPTAEPFTRLQLTPEVSDDGQSEWAAHLPIQPAAGKLEYRLVFEVAGTTVRVPSDEDAALGEGTIIIRYKDPVPLPVLLSHVACMFLGMLLGLRAGLGALFAPGNIRRLSWTTLGFLTVGGMVLGPIVQKFTFDAYWTGFPWGYDLTDNKTLIMWVAWIAACAALGRRRSNEPPNWVRRAVVVTATVVTTGVYLIPHSLRGSELDYAQVDAGVDPTEAVGTGN